MSVHGADPTYTLFLSARKFVQLIVAGAVDLHEVPRAAGSLTLPTQPPLTFVDRYRRTPKSTV